MTKLILVTAVLVTAAAFASQAEAARGNAAARHSHAMAMSGNGMDCQRAPNVGAFATAPYASPPCMPNAGN
jgi:hypothetical protein